MPYPRLFPKTRDLIDGLSPDHEEHAEEDDDDADLQAGGPETESAASNSCVKRRPSSDSAVAAEPRKRSRFKRRDAAHAPSHLPEGLDALGARAGLTTIQVKLFRILKLPTTLMILFVVLERTRWQTGMPSLAGAEFFAGAGHVAAAFSKRGLDYLTFEKYDSECKTEDLQDITEAIGFNTALLWTWCIGQHGLIWLGTVCSSWVFLSRGATGRNNV